MDLPDSRQSAAAPTERRHRQFTRSSVLILGVCAPLSALAVLKRDATARSVPPVPTSRALAGSTTPTPSRTRTGTRSAPAGSEPGKRSAPAGSEPGTLSAPAGSEPGTPPAGSETVPALPPEPPVAQGGPPVPVGGPTGVVWSRPVFHDEFSGTELDTSIWHPGWFGDGVLSGPVNSGHESAAYATDHITVAGGKITFRVGPNTTGRSVDGQTYLNIGAQITSDPLQGADPGYLSPGVDYYIECSAHLPAGNFGPRALPLASFWQDAQDWPAGFEIDIVEGFGTESGLWRVHYPRSPGSSTQASPAPGGATVVPGATTGFHSYGALVEGPRTGLPTGRISFYYDGSLVGSVTPTLPVADAGRYLVLGNSAGGRIALPHDVYAVFDYVRVWTWTGTPSVTPS